MYSLAWLLDGRDPVSCINLNAQTSPEIRLASSACLWKRQVVSGAECFFDRSATWLHAYIEYAHTYDVES